MEENYQTAVRQFYCWPPPSSSTLQSAAAAQTMFTTSARRRCHHRHDASARVIGGPADTAGPAPATEGLDDTSAHAHATEGPGNAFIAGHAAPASVSAVGQPDAAERMEDTQPPVCGSRPFQGFKKRLVLVLASESSNEGFEDEQLPGPIPGLASEGPASSASASESPAALLLPPRICQAPSQPLRVRQPLYQSPRLLLSRHKSPRSLRCGSWLPPELCVCMGRPPGRQPELCACTGWPPSRLPELTWFTLHINVCSVYSCFEATAPCWRSDASELLRYLFAMKRSHTLSKDS
ncbi:hypothetical protein CRENBAI_004424 [Crenichthys baileyi]|uniref:Uncharacterized protein n=1 Tax=Crenichthys baileyi TaxID=28760 RepID=A0AAV9QSQ4_9TELE